MTGAAVDQVTARAHAETCPECCGSGACDVCDGYGTCPEGIECEACSGEGTCPGCYGTED